LTRSDTDDDGLLRMGIPSGWAKAQVTRARQRKPLMKRVRGGDLGMEEG
jgi:hypothetical protein